MQKSIVASFARWRARLQPIASANLETVLTSMLCKTSLLFKGFLSTIASPVLTFLISPYETFF